MIDASRYGLIADIGGTNARFALAGGGLPAGTFEQVIKLKCADYPTVADAANAYLDQVHPEKRPNAGVLAVAGPVNTGVIDLTNHVWHDTVDQVRTGLGFEKLIAINDFEAVAHGVTVLGRDHWTEIGGPVPEPPSAGPKVHAITGPGTGLGAALLVTGHGEPLVIGTEGGHASFAPQTERQREIKKFLRHDYSRVSVERLLSGPGLVNLHRAIAAIEGADQPDLRPADITRLALQGDAICAATLNEFFAVLGTFCGDLALVTGSLTGVYLGGGILPPLVDQLKASQFRAMFEAKGRFEGYMKAIPTRLIMADDPGLMGVSALLGRLQTKG